MKIPLDVSSHCVQTAARSAHESFVRSALKVKGGELSELEEIIEALRLFLETADFSALRSAHPALAGSSAARVAFETDGNGGFSLYLEGSQVV